MIQLHKTEHVRSAASFPDFEIKIIWWIMTYHYHCGWLNYYSKSVLCPTRVKNTKYKRLVPRKESELRAESEECAGGYRPRLDSDPNT